MKVSELFARIPASVDWERVSRESMPLFLLATDIRKNGLKEPILLDEDGKIVDGIHRMFVLWLLEHDGDVPTMEVVREGNTVRDDYFEDASRRRSGSPGRAAASDTDGQG